MECLWCGEEHLVELLEYYPESRTFQLDTCCEGAHEEAVDWLNDADPRDLGEWMTQQLGYKVRQLVVDWNGGARYGNGGISVDEGLHLEPITLADAKAWVAKHHRHNDAPLAWLFGEAVYNGHELVGVVMVARPVARLLDDGRACEVTRLCVDPSLPSWVSWNACSMLYGAAARTAKARGYQRILTYTREDESGHTLVASGWHQVYRTKLDKRNWQRPGRKASSLTRMKPCRKIRWERGLTKPAKRDVQQRAAAFAHKKAA